jgi:RNase H-like domain found in reverse transcriptase
MNTPDDTAIIYGKAQSEEKKKKIIQATQNNAKNIEKFTDEESNEPQTIEKSSDSHLTPKTSNSVPFPSTDTSSTNAKPEPNPDDQLMSQKYAVARESDLLKADTMKKRFMEEPVLLMPNQSKPLQIESDTSKVATGGVLTQLDSNGKRHPIAFLSKTFSETERKYEIYDPELLGII